MRRSYLIDGVDVPVQVKAILDYLHSNLYNRITVSDVAAHVGKSESAVKALFSLYRSEGIMHYYNARKISEAKRLIREGRYNFSQIADLLHYDNPQYFSKCFRRFANMTPREYKASIIK